MHPQYTAIYRNVTRHSTLDSTFRWLSLPTRFWYIASPCSISLNFGVPRHSTAARAVCAPASAANCWSKVTYFKERKRTDYLGNARHTRGRLEGREDEFHAFFESFFTLPMPALRPMPTISSLPAFLVLLFRHPLLLHYPSDERRRLRVLSSRLSPIISPSLPSFIIPESVHSRFFNSTSRRDFLFFSSLEFNRLEGKAIGSLNVIETAPLLLL